MPNRLIHETSPYLLQHAHNPVDWNPWDNESLMTARSLDRPILLSIGYSACHWCHVMEEESFTNEAIAKQMNEHFVCIKVDREERPDLDAIYMQSVIALTGRGGWPMTVFLMPDGRPFYGGTYYPPEDRHGLPGFSRLLSLVSDAYRHKREQILNNATILTDHIRSASAIPDPADPLREDIEDQAFHGIGQSYDNRFGGFGSAPKFPQAMTLGFLLRFHKRTGDVRALDIAKHTLSCMAQGGIYDHLGGGFHRYSTDHIWLVPHFEKMLYDNALLGQVYLEAYQITKNSEYRSIAKETLNYLLRETIHNSGGFCSSQDADTEGVEGRFYVWEEQEIDSLLTPSESAIAKIHFGVTSDGNFEGVNVLNTIESKRLNVTEVEQNSNKSKTIERARNKMLRKRSKRTRPMVDDKILTSWNGLAIRTMAEASIIVNGPEYREAAENAAGFILENLYKDGRLLRTWRKGKAHLPGYLEDYASLILSLIALHEATFDHKWLFTAHSLTDEMIMYFWDNETNTFFDVGWDAEDLIVRPRESADNAIPSGCSLAAECLLRIGRLTGNTKYLTMGENLLQSVTSLACHHPLGFGNWLKVLELYHSPPAELAIVGNPKDQATRRLIGASKEIYDPNRIFIGLRPDEDPIFYSPILEGRALLKGQPTAYVCRNYSCDLPTSNPKTLADQLLGPNFTQGQ